MLRPASPLDTLFSRYDLARPSAFRPVDAGLLNRSFQVVSAGRRYFLKHYLPWRGDGFARGLPDPCGRPRSADATLRWQHHAAAALAATGFPAIAPLTDRSGDSLVRIRGRPFALFPWIDGTHRTGTELDPRSARHLGSTLAGLHTGLTVVLPPVPQPLFAPTTSEREAVSNARELLRMVRARAEPDEMDELAEYRLLERLRILPEVADRRPGPHTFGTVGYVHGDFHKGNVLWSATESYARIVAVLDWEKTTVAPYADEVVSAAIVFFTDQYSGLPDLDLIRAFVAGYTHSHPQMTAAELRTAVHRVWWERLTDFWILVWRYRLGDDRADSLLPGTAALVPWWTENYDKLLAAFLDTLEGGAANSARPRVPAMSRVSGAAPLIGSRIRTVADHRRAGAAGYR